MAPPSIPRATYRLQFSKDLTFAQAEALVPYLAQLGISHLYASSFLKARPGSAHGYDIVDHNALNPEIGDEADLARLVAALARHDMGLVLDVVPNHMAVGGADNEWWLDVLEWGQDSPYADYFDIDWQASRREFRGKVLLPFLGDHYGTILEKGELVPRFDRRTGTVSVWYWGHRFPIAPSTYGRLLAPAVDQLSPQVAEKLAKILHEARGLEGGRSDSRALTARRHLAEGIAQRLKALDAAHDAIDHVLSRLATDVPALHHLLERQAYRVSYWRTAADEINYRRFFDINDLAGLRMEDPDLFQLAHRKVFAMLAGGQVNGLRIDHVDGLYNPAQYCRRLQEAAGKILGRPDDEQPIWLVVEKILGSDERIRRDWPVAGSTGYDFAAQVVALFVDGRNEALTERVYASFIGRYLDFEQEVYGAKKQIIRDVMSSELNVLAAKLARIAATHWRSRDFTQASLSAALAEVVACFPVYRTYVTSSRLTELDRRYIDRAVARARQTAPEIDGAIFDFLHSVLDTSAAHGSQAGYGRTPVVDFAMHFQQYTGPVMAKGVEDTALYRYNRLLALNDVGCDPQRFGLEPADFHDAMRRRRQEKPHTMLATATHDSKRGEDVRARLAALSEMPDEWGMRLERWARLNAPFKQELEGGLAPEANDEILLYQTLLGAWPIQREPDADFIPRLTVVLTKSLREAKKRTSWGHPDPGYEDACALFMTRILEQRGADTFLDDFLPFQRRLARLGMVNGLAQTVLKMTTPGVPDFYQGTELWQLALVDPDNRRPVDWEHLVRMASSVGGKLPADLLTGWADGAIKLSVIQTVLAHRRTDPDLYAEGDYQALMVRGDRRDHVVAYARTFAGRGLVVAIPRLMAELWPESTPLPPLGRAWRGLSVELPIGLASLGMRNILSGEAITAAVGRRGKATLSGEDLFSRYPVALLIAS